MTDYPLRDLKPGSYLLRVQAASTGGQMAQRELLFEVK
jgi:hypothetical protein